MRKVIVGKKISMTQIFDEKRNVVPVTVVEAGPCVVSRKKTVRDDGYATTQVGFGDRKLNRLNKPPKSHFAKADVTPERTLREFKLSSTDAYNVGDLIKADVFEKGDRVDISGTSEGKGYAGAVKRWNFQRLKKTHGAGPVAKHRGSLDASSSLFRVFKGLRAAKHMGAEKVIVQNLTIVKVDTENNSIAIKGATLSPNDDVVVIRDSIKA